MKNLVIVLAAIFVLVSCSKDEITPVVYSDDELEILRLINAHRESIGKSALEMDETIYNISMQHSVNMANGVVPHGHDGFYDRADQIKEVHGSGGTAENVAMGYRSPAAVVNGWLNSSGHKKNIEGTYNICGIAIAENDGGTLYYTHMFFNKFEETTNQ
ncbi:MAG: CAP domain-containing protein [Bacteroidales bacterium]|nr:CAP domain-containing protein [Bacteroidales bacterium]